YTVATIRSRSDDRIALADPRDAKSLLYAEGVILELRKAGVPVGGVEIEAGGDLPLGAGLSSSASFEVAIALGALGIADAELDRLELAKLCRRAENEHVGIRSGIMDQYAVLFGKRDRAVLIDSESLQHRYVEIPHTASIVICNTMVKHQLAAGEYNKRREECEAAVQALRRWHPHLTSLRHVTLEELLSHEAQLDGTIFRRARHVVTENARVMDAAEALERGDVAAFGRLMNASHESLRDDYEVSADELDTMVAIARRCDGVYGARMTGGGFGGCTVNLVAPAAVDAFREHIVREYHAATGITPAIYDGTPVDGASASTT
ncbi:MAG TPA: galactokinase, partial [Candidatus Baltobacteraceae bacterium]|nr:galactokinase [Candidatus Baltobacteraceae bacterium]